MDKLVQFIIDAKGTVILKADGSTPATLNPPQGGWQDGQWLSQYIEQEFRLGNFAGVLKRKGYASIFLVSPHGYSVLHARVTRSLDSFSVHYLD